MPVTKHYPQGSREWIAQRVGLVTASRCADVLAVRKDGFEKSERRDYRSELMVEILTHEPFPRRVTPEMQWGIDQEQFARAAYEMKREVMVDTCGFLAHPDIARFGASPDGLVELDGIVEIKCPTTATHLGWMMGNAIPVEHIPQMLAGLSCCPEREWSDFVSYDPRLPEHLQLFVRRLYRDDDFIAKLEAEVVHFNAELDGELARLPRGPQNVVNILDYQNADEMEL